MADFYQRLKGSAYSWITRELKITTLFAEQYEIEPEKTPFAVIRIDGIYEPGFMDESGEVDDDGNAKIEGHRQATITVEIVGKGSMELGIQLQASLSKVTVLSNFWNNYGVAILDRGIMRNLTDLLETKSRERIVMEITIGFAVEFDDYQGNIEWVEINGDTIPVVQT